METKNVSNERGAKSLRSFKIPACNYYQWPLASVILVLGSVGLLHADEPYEFPTVKVTPLVVTVCPCNPTATVSVNPSEVCPQWVDVTNWTLSSQAGHQTYLQGIGDEWIETADSTSLPCWISVPSLEASAGLSAQVGITSPAVDSTNNLSITIELNYTDSNGIPHEETILTNVTVITSTDCSTCSGGCSANAGAVTTSQLGAGNTSNDQGPALKISLGSLSAAQNAGSLELNARTTSASLTSPAALTIPYQPSVGGVAMDVVTSSGNISQIALPQGLVNVVATDGNGYLLQFYTSYTGSAPGPYTGSGAIYDTWEVTNSGGNTNILVVSESLTGHQFTYTWTTNDSIPMWQMTDSNNIRTVLSWSAPVTVESISATNFVLEILSGATLVQETQKMYATPSGCAASVLLQEIDGSGSTTNTTTYYYNSDGLLEEVVYPYGNWAAYAYDSHANVTAAYSPYGNASPPTPGFSPPPSAPYKVTYDTYAYTSTYSGDDVSSFQPGIARKEVVEINTGSGETEVSRLYRSVPTPSEVEEWRCPLPGASIGDTGNLLTTTVTANDTSDLNVAGKQLWQVRPDGTATINTYMENGTGTLTNVIIKTGSPDSTSAPSTIVDGTLTSNVLNSLGGVTASTTLNVSGGVAGPVISQQTYTYTDTLLRNYELVDLANRTNYVTFACCGLDETIDPESVVTVYNYDGLSRVTGTTVSRGTPSTSTLNTLDAAGRVTISQMIGTNSGSITTQTTAYDVLGRPVLTTNALGGVATNVYALVSGGSGLQQSNTTFYPDGGTRVEVYYSDGRLASVSGSAVAPVTYHYGADTGADGYDHEYTLTTKLSGTGGTSESTTNYTDGAGRNFKTIYAAASGTPSATSYFNGGGQLTQQVDPDGVGTLYGYDDQGRQIYRAVDISTRGTMDFTGTDRITLTTNDVVSDNGCNVNRTQVFAWTTGGSASTALISTSEASVNGLTNWSITWNNGGAQGVTNKMANVYANGVNRTVTSTAPDGSYIVSAYQYGELLSTTRYDKNGSQVGATSYGYDQYWRQNAVTDARTGTTTSWFNNMGQVSGTATPTPASGQSAEVTTNSFDLMGRVIKTTLPDATSVTNVYNLMGLIITNCGSRVYPVAYLYDAQGRMTNMITWTNFASGTGAATTTWNYDAYRGWLTSKLDNSSHGPAYAYTLAGRLASRMWARGTNTTYTTNAAGDIATIVYNDGTPGVTNAYDRRGRLVAVTNGPTVCALLLNDAGEVLSESYTGGPVDGVVVSNTYDYLLRRTNLSVFHSGTLLFNETNSFDAAGRLASVSDGTNAAAYSYLANSRLVGQIVFAHNGAAQMTATKTYDNLNRLTGIVNGNGTIPAVDSHSYAYNKANQRTNAAEVDGSYWVYTYDNLGQVTGGIKHWSDGTVVSGQQFDYTFDTIGNRTSTEAGGDQMGANLRSASYANNLLNQITSRGVPGYVDVMGLTLATNTVSVNGTGAYQKYEYFREQVASVNTSAAQWASISVTAPGQTTVSGHEFVAQTPEQPTYDLDGNLTQDGRWTYTWDAENRLVNMTSLAGGPAGSLLELAYVYDYMGRRTQKLVSTNNGSYVAQYTNRYVYDGWNPVAIVNPVNALVESFVWGLDLSGSMQGAGGVGGLLEENLVGNGAQFVAYDGNGNVVALVSATNGMVTANYEYGPFGEVIRATGPMAKLNPFRFSTKYQDNETDFLYYGYRYYNPSTGRWLSRDPMEEEGGLPLYALAGNDSIDFSDATGLCAICNCIKLLSPTSDFKPTDWHSYTVPIPPDIFGNLPYDQPTYGFTIPINWELGPTPDATGCTFAESETGGWAVTGPNGKTSYPANGGLNPYSGNPNADHPGVPTMTPGNYNLSLDLTATYYCTGTDGVTKQQTVHIKAKTSVKYPPDPPKTPKPKTPVNPRK